MKVPKYRAWIKLEAEKQRMAPVSDITILKHGINILTDNHWYFYTDDEHELMEFTGLLDKNGKEIYEGDLVRYIDGIKEITCQVKFIKEYACFGVEWRNGLLVSFEYLESTYTMLDDLEVVGNIYENPELLGGS